MLPKRPKLDDLLQYSDDYANAKDQESRLEFEYEVFVANCVRRAMTAGAKSRDIDLVKVIGNNEVEAATIKEMKEKIFEAHKKASILWGKIEAWKSERDLFRTDSYNMVGGYKNYTFEEDK